MGSPQTASRDVKEAGTGNGKGASRVPLCSTGLTLVDKAVLETVLAGPECDTSFGNVDIEPRSGSTVPNLVSADPHDVSLEAIDLVSSDEADETGAWSSESDIGRRSGSAVPCSLSGKELELPVERAPVHPDCDRNAK